MSERLTDQARRAALAKLTAEEYREALQLVLAELEAMGLPPADQDGRYAYAERRARLLAHIQTLVGCGPYGTEPMYGLRALRRPGGDRDHQEEP